MKWHTMNLRLALIVMVSGFNAVAQPTEDIISGAASTYPLPPRGAVTLVPPAAAGVAENGTLASVSAAAALAAGGAGGGDVDDRISVEIVPGIGVGPVLFGMTRGVVRDSLACIGLTFYITIERCYSSICYEIKRDSFDGLCVEYDSENKCCFIGIECNQINALLASHNLSKMKKKELVAFLKGLDKSCVDFVDGLAFPELGISLELSLAEADESEEEDEELLPLKIKCLPKETLKKLSIIPPFKIGDML
ncbi:MAG: hypothetical protein J0G29_00195 [Alphaproteobacteria bacterium]|nr:hypothetical protein [Alphaproteobacteria bacterium]